ncbi:MAG TPA: HAMP domain-containing sensor histidine kinase, partial [Phototrophicaceae bacterium]|nr:HAMP domain-containing sensor histidine kinase [Phototrophicaceae bacterium]
SLKLRIEALQDDTLPVDQTHEYLTEAAQEVQRMADLVTSLLTLARLDEGKHFTQIEAFDLEAGLHDIVHYWRIQAQQAGLVLHDDIAVDLPQAKIRAAELRIVLDNLLNNAVKYTPTGGEIWFKAIQQLNCLQITLRDTGIGFSRDDQSHLFERFYRADQSHSSQIPGHGLGLAIVAALIERSGGNILAESPGEGRGSTFTLQLPALSV